MRKDLTLLVRSPLTVHLNFILAPCPEELASVPESDRTAQDAVPRVSSRPGPRNEQLPKPKQLQRQKVRRPRQEAESDTEVEVVVEDDEVAAPNGEAEMAAVALAGEQKPKLRPTPKKRPRVLEDGGHHRGQPSAPSRGPARAQGSGRLGLRRAKTVPSSRRQVQVSKALSRVLRHVAVRHGIQI